MDARKYIIPVKLLSAKGILTIPEMASKQLESQSRKQSYNSSMRPCLAILLGLALHPFLSAQSLTVLSIRTVVTESSNQQEYEAFLRHNAQECSRIGCPLSYLVFQSLANPNEKWFVETLNWEEKEYAKSFSSYPCNSSFVPFRGTSPIPGRNYERYVYYGWCGAYRPDLSHGTQWKVGQDKLLIIRRTKGQPTSEGSVFESPIKVPSLIFTTVGGGFLSIAPAPGDAEAVAAAANADLFTKSNVIVAVLRPELSVPKKEWIDADPDLWVRHSSAKDVRPVITSGSPSQ